MSTRPTGVSPNGSNPISPAHLLGIGATFLSDSKDLRRSRPTGTHMPPRNQNTLFGFTDVPTENGSSKGHNLALTFLDVPSSLELEPFRLSTPPSLDPFFTLVPRI